MADKKPTHTCVRPFRTFTRLDGRPVEDAEYFAGDPVTDPPKKAIEAGWVKSGYKETKS